MVGKYLSPHPHTHKHTHTPPPPPHTHTYTPPPHARTHVHARTHSHMMLYYVPYYLEEKWKLDETTNVFDGVNILLSTEYYIILWFGRIWVKVFFASRIVISFLILFFPFARGSDEANEEIMNILMTQIETDTLQVEIDTYCWFVWKIM